MAKKQRRPQQKATANQLRIIGGQWRGRKLSFPSEQGLRPTPDRVRETLFNWLAPVIPGAVCVDLFAGSGALGLEAQSRGAQSVYLIDQSRAVYQALLANVSLLKSEQTQVVHASALDWLSTSASTLKKSIDIAFIDPPYHQGLVTQCIEKLNANHLLADQSWVYVEMAKDESLPLLPNNWRLHREKVAGLVCYRLFQVGNNNAEED